MSESVIRTSSEEVGEADWSANESIELSVHSGMRMTGGDPSVEG